MIMNNYYAKPCRVMFKIKKGYRVRLADYAFITQMKIEGRYIRAWSTSTGKAF